MRHKSRDTLFHRYAPPDEHTHSPQLLSRAEDASFLIQEQIAWRVFIQSDNDPVLGPIAEKTTLGGQQINAHVDTVIMKMKELRDLHLKPRLLKYEALISTSTSLFSSGLVAQKFNAWLATLQGVWAHGNGVQETRAQFCGVNWVNKRQQLYNQFDIQLIQGVGQSWPGPLAWDTYDGVSRTLELLLTASAFLLIGGSYTNVLALECKTLSEDHATADPSVVFSEQLTNYVAKVVDLVSLYADEKFGASSDSFTLELLRQCWQLRLDRLRVALNEWKTAGAHSEEDSSFFENFAVLSVDFCDLLRLRKARPTSGTFADMGTAGALPATLSLDVLDEEPLVFGADFSFGGSISTAAQQNELFAPDNKALQLPLQLSTHRLRQQEPTLEYDFVKISIFERCPKLQDNVVFMAAHGEIPDADMLSGTRRYGMRTSGTVLVCHFGSGVCLNVDNVTRTIFFS